MTKPLLAKIYFPEGISPEDFEHKKYIAQKELDWCLRNRPNITVEIYGEDDN